MIRIGFDPWVYDTNGDCYISASEAMAAQHDWQLGIITMSNANEVINLWLMSTKNPACEIPPPPPEIAAHIESASVWYYTNSTEHLAADFPADLPLDTRIQCSVVFCNDSGVEVILRTLMEIIDPDGMVRASSSPGFLTDAEWCQERRVPSSAKVILDKAGIWQLHAVLEEAVCEGEVYTINDEKTWNVINASEEPGPPPGNASLIGVVVDQEEAPLPGVLAILTNLGEATTTSDAEGRFEFRNIAKGNYQLICKKAGYKTVEQYVVLESGGNDISVILIKEAFPWQWLAIGGVALAGGILLIPKPKR